MKSLWIVLVVLLASSAVVLGEEPAPPVPTVTLTAQETPMSEAIAAMAKSAGVPILSADVGGLKLSASFREMALDKALQFVCKSKGLSWRRVWTVPGPKGELDVKKIAKAVRAMNEIETSGLMVQDPESGSTSVSLRAIPAGTKIEPSTLPGKPAMKVIYFVYGKEPSGTVVVAQPDMQIPDDPAMDEADASVGPDGQDAPLSAAAASRVGKFAHQQAMTLSTLQQMSPGERRAAMKNDMQLFNQLNPKAKQDLARTGLQMYMTMDQVTRNKLATQVRKDMKLPRSQFVPGVSRPPARKH